MKAGAMPKKQIILKNIEEQRLDYIAIYDIISRVKLIYKAFEKKEALKSGETVDKTQEPVSFMQHVSW